MIGRILSWLLGDGVAAIGRELRQARLDAINARGSQDRLVADLYVQELEARMKAREQAAQLRLETSGFWEMRLLTFVIAGCFAFHLLLVTLDTCFRLGWKIPAFPSPFDEWQGAILLSFFGVQVVGQGINAIAAAVRGRR